jgi:membrane protein YqaA with SNARE-associated domain
MRRKFMNMLNYLIKKNAMLGVFIGMFLESSCVPIPSEAVLLAFGTTVPVRTVTIAGSIGSTAGGIVGYYIGSKGGQPLVRAIGPYIGVDEGKINRAQDWFNKSTKTAENMKKRMPWMPERVLDILLSPGGIFVLVSRCVPFIPFKVFSISSGVLGISIWPFIVYTAIGSVPRCFILATVGKKLERYKKPVLLSIGALVVFYILFHVVKTAVFGH